VNVVDLSDADKREALASDPFSVAINEAIDRAATAEPRPTRGYLGASAIGGDCDRRIQFDWLCGQIVDAKQARIFARGHFFEAALRTQLVAAGFHFAPDPALAFIALGGRLQGHVDGIIIGAPAMPGTYFPIPRIWECKAVKNDSWTRCARDGLAKTFPAYLVQVLLYQRFLKEPNPALFSVVNANDCRALHIPVPYDEELAEKAIRRAEFIIAAAEKGTLLNRGHPTPDSWQCRRSCGHRERCWSNP
jgi:hypothetical protein